MSNKKTNIQGLFFLLLVLCLSSCNVSKYLDSNEYIVRKNKINFLDKENSADSPDLIYNLEAIIIQKPNTRFVGTPRELIYFRNQEEYDNTSEEQRKGRLKEARLPVIQDDLIMRETADRMEKFLRNSKGFYYAKVVPSAKLSNNRAEITYNIITDSRYKVRSKEYFVDDPGIKFLIDKYESGTLIKEGTNIDESIFSQEKSRLAEKIQNKGYFYFNESHIEFKADSSDLSMDIFVSINAPQEGGLHQKFNIGKINVYLDHDVLKEVILEQEIDGINYKYTTEEPYVKPNAIGRVIQIKEGDEYKKRHVNATVSSLTKLGTFRWITVKEIINPEDNTIDFDIELSSYENNWAVEGNLTLFYTFLPQNGSISRLGLSANTALTNSNTFGGAEKLNLSVESTGEVTLDQEANTNFTFTPQISLSYPRLRDNTTVIRRLLSICRTEEEVFKIFDNTITKYEANYSYVQQINAYITNSINAGASYSYRRDSKYNFIFTPFRINSLTTSSIAPDFQMLLDDSPLLASSFEPRFITTFGIPQLLIQMSTPIFSSGFNWNFRVNTEVSGVEVLGLNGVYNYFTGNNNLWEIPINQNSFEFSRFALLDLDVNATQRFFEKNSVAGRFRFGLARPILQDDVIPFVKQFFVGGANSVRGWQTRELGPGGFNQVNNGNTAFFQSGDIVLEGSVELRYPLFWDFEGAFFVDAGNVWTIKEDSARIGAQFKFNEFYKQIAISTGFGLRWDLDFLLIRVDLGYRLRNNYNEGNGHSALPDPNFSSILNYAISPNPLFGLSYPF